MIKRVLFAVAILLILFDFYAAAQSLKPYLNIPVTENGRTLNNPWAGGMDTPILQPVDLNGDGIKDLFIFEKGGTSPYFFRYVTFINKGTPGKADYIYAPEYIAKFPEFLHDWVLLVDYNCDGREDIFTYSFTGGMTAYRNDYSLSEGLKFTQTYEVVNSSYFNFKAPLYISSVNQPALADIDNDGDLDVLTFGSASNNIEYHRNYGKEFYGRCDTLVMELEKSCWGKICLNPFSNTALFNCAPIDGCADGPRLTARNGEEYLKNKIQNQKLHSGSCMIAPDIDGDLDKDIINGDILGNNLLLMLNSGNISEAKVDTQDSLFPSYNVPVNFKIFPAPYCFDADNDGNKDLIVTGCIANASRNFNNVLFYKNITDNNSNRFAYIKNSLFTDEMIDVGSGARAAITDINADGLPDMIIGNYKYTSQDAPDYSALAYYRNTGSLNQPSFNLENKDFAGISSLPLLGISPSFGDLDNDGDADMVLGSDDGYLHYFKNTAGQGNTANYVLEKVRMQDATGAAINAGSFAAPQIIDLNRDGKPDLVIGNKAGRISYYENTGTAENPAFTFNTDALGGVNVKQTPDLYGYSTPFFYDSLGTYILYSGSLRGFIYKYNDIDNNLNGNFILADSMLLHEPILSTITGTDINGDGRLDLLAGNYAGGVTWYSDFNTPVSKINYTKKGFTVFPNPAKDILYLKFENPAANARQIVITDILGKIVFSKKSRVAQEIIDLGAFSNGMYVCRVAEDEKIITKKFIVQHIK